MVDALLRSMVYETKQLGILKKSTIVVPVGQEMIKYSIKIMLTTLEDTDIDMLCKFILANQNKQ